MLELPEMFDRNTSIWLNYKFSFATLKEIGDAFGLTQERVRQIGLKRDMKVRHALIKMGYDPLFRFPPYTRKILDTLYGIRISHQLDNYGEYEIHLTLEDQEKIDALVVSVVGRPNNVRNEKGCWVSHPANR